MSLIIILLVRTEFKTVTHGMPIRIWNQLSHQFGIRENRKKIIYTFNNSKYEDTAPANARVVQLTAIVKSISERDVVVSLFSSFCLSQIDRVTGQRNNYGT